MRKIAVVAGLTGVGKDFLVDRANVDPFKVNRVNWGTLFGERVGKSRDGLGDYLPGRGQTDHIQRLVCDQVVSLEPVIVTSHPVKIVGRVTHTNWETERQLQPSMYVYIAAPAELIADRVMMRNASGLRQSPELDLDTIEEIQRLQLQGVEDLAQSVGADLLTLNNIPELVEYNTALLQSDIIKKLGE
jgi:adenylate kinase